MSITSPPLSTTTRLIAKQVLRTGGKCILANWYDYQLLVIAGVNMFWLVDETTSLLSLRAKRREEWITSSGFRPPRNDRSK